MSSFFKTLFKVFKRLLLPALIAGEDRDTVSVADNGESIVVTVIMNDSSAGEGRFYSSPPSFSSLVLVASLTK